MALGGGIKRGGKHVPVLVRERCTGDLGYWECGPRLNTLVDKVQRVPEALPSWSWGDLATDSYGPVTLPTKMPRETRMRLLRKGCNDYLPQAWMKPIDKLIKAAIVGAPVWRRDGMAGDVYGRLLTRYAGADGADLSEQGIRDRADAIAKRAKAAKFEPDKKGPWHAWGRLCDFVDRYGGTIVPTKKIKTLASWAARAGCAKWWRRVLRKCVAQTYETGARELGMIGAAAGQWYCSNRSVKRRIQQNNSNAAAMKAEVIESASGQKMTVWDAAQLTVSNKAIRRGELMTRIRGCEVWADKLGMAGVFTTNTLPSRFHRAGKGGALNPKWDGSTPGDGQAWLRLQWSRLRATLAREGIPIMGFRVVEPHHDGTPHWHMLLWCHPDHVERLSLAMWLAWLPVDDAMDWEEAGALMYRTNIKPMIAGMASGYIAKYIAKNIDDANIDKHGDADEVPGMTVGPDLLGDEEVKPCQRVEAWAADWRIRQFAAIGQPSVTVWRELRRVTQDVAAAGSDAFILAWLSVHRKGEKKADWAEYMARQGGAMLPRKEYRFCAHTSDRDKVGRYETVREKWTCGVRDAKDLGPLPVSPTKRERWGSEGFAARAASPPWTRLNNCTRHNSRGLGKMSATLEELRMAGLLESENGFNGWEVDEIVVKTPWLNEENPW